MNKRKALGILSLFLAIFSMIFAIEPKGGKALGDIIFDSLGLKAWSNGTSGLHNVVIFALILLFISYIGVKIFLKEFYPNLLKRLPLILLAIFLLYPIGYQQANKLIRSNFTDLRAIQYYEESSELNYNTNEDKKIEINASLDLENYSKEEIQFYIKILPTESQVEHTFENKEIIIKEMNSNTPRKFILPGKGRIKYNVSFEIPLRDSDRNGSGHAYHPNIIIYNGEEERRFID